MRSTWFLSCAVFVSYVVLGVTANLPGRPGIDNCTLTWFEQPVSHFSATPPFDGTWKQRVYSNDEYFKCGGPIFFYTGNEGPVELYVNHMGLMWENAEEFNAQLVFAEHRYYGKSQLFDPPRADGPHLQFLTANEALEDYARILIQLQDGLVAKCGAESPVIAFGGSYGGMLSLAFRIKYSTMVRGAISASAPILFFPDMPMADQHNYWEVVTNDADSQCQSNIRSAWNTIFSMGDTSDGRAQLSSIFRTCTPVSTPFDAQRLALFHLFALDSMAMGMYSHPSSYMTGGQFTLPAYPITEGCKALQSPLSGTPLLEGLKAATDVFNNVSGIEKCYPLPVDLFDEGTLWGYQHCQGAWPEETWFTRTGTTDMFWPGSFNQSYIEQSCMERFNISTDWLYGRSLFGSLADITAGASNVVFSQGSHDPWSAGGIKQSLSPVLPAVFIDGVGHHQDLFFSYPSDPPSVVAARKVEVANIREWIK